MSLQAGSRAENYQLSFTEPFLFDRNITGGATAYRRTIRYYNQFTQQATGGNLTTGFPLAGFSRMFLTYGYEAVTVSDLNAIYYTPETLANNPYLADSLLIGEGGRRTISKITPSFVHNTVDNPIFPNTGRRITGSVDVAGLGGNTSFLKPQAEYSQFFQHTKKTSVGFRAQIEYIKPFAGTVSLPITETLYLGGEYSVRGFDIRSIGPRDPRTGLVLGGNKSLLFNGEYLISIAGPVRLVLFFDAGQIQTRGQPFSLKEDVTRTVFPAGPILVDPFTTTSLVDPNAPLPERVVIGETNAFKTSTGAEIRFFMPVLNVPFRLIFAANPSRQGVFDNNGQPAKHFTFKFAVGSTF